MAQLRQAQCHGVQVLRVLGLREVFFKVGHRAFGLPLYRPCQAAVTIL